jgi:hypothetical protein
MVGSARRLGLITGGVAGFYTGRRALPHPLLDGPWGRCRSTPRRLRSPPGLAGPLRLDNATLA